MKVGIVGSGLVGATAGYALGMSGVGREVVLVDKNRERAEAEVDDLRHAVPFAHPLDVRAGDYEALKGCGTVFAEIEPQVVAAAPEAVSVRDGTVALPPGWWADRASSRRSIRR